MARTVDTNTTPVDYSKHFKRKEHKGPKIICKYCKYEIDPKPRNNINGRRHTHLQECKKYPYKPDTFDLSDEDYSDIKLATKYDDHHENLNIILPSASSM